MTDWNEQMLHARWAAIPNDEIGGWSVTTDGRSPLDGGRMAADLVMTREIAEHIADLHNRWWSAQHVTVSPAVAVIRGERHQVTPLTIAPASHAEVADRHRQIADAYERQRPHDEENP